MSDLGLHCLPMSLKKSLGLNMLTLCVPIEFSIKFDTVKSGWSIVYIEGSHVLKLDTVKSGWSIVYYVEWSQ